MTTVIQQLKNSLKVVVHPMPHMQSVSVGLWLGVGGRYETKSEAGMAHFMEHIVFKGTKNRSCQDIKEHIEGIGGSLNAFTSKESTCFYAKVLGKDVSVALDVLADMVFYPSLHPSDIEQEKDVVVEEMKMYMDTPSQQVHEELDEVLWPEHPLGYMLTGTEANVRALTKERLTAFRNTFYVPHNMVVSVAGNINVQEVLSHLEQLIPLPVKKNAVPACEPWQQRKQTPRVRWQKKDTEQAHVVIGIPSYPRFHEKSYAAALLSVILGGNMSSRLFKDIREERGLAYDIRSSVYRYADTGTMEIAAGLEPEKTQELVNVTLSHLDQMCQDPVRPDELLRAKKYYQGSVQMAMEKPSECMSWMGEDYLFADHVRSFEHIMKEIERVTAEDIRFIARDLFHTQNMGMAIIAPHADEEALKVTFQDQ